MSLIDILVSALISVIAGLAVAEFYAWSPKLVSTIIQTAVGRLPRHSRDRYAEEWSSHIAEVPGSLAQIWHAIGFFWGAGNMFPRWRRSIHFRRARARSVLVARVVTRLIDLYISWLTIFLLAPLLLAVAIAVRLNGRGPVLFKSPRIGRGGRIFFVYKFRTIALSALDCLDQIPHSTNIGSFIRKSSIDKLPTLFNVAFGQMSIFGPSWRNLKDDNLKPGIIGASPFPVEIINGRPLGIISSIGVTLAHHVKVIFWSVRSFS